MKLFETTQLGNIKLQNRIVMAPMTRSRAVGHQPNELMAQYYKQRASAGLIITEGTSPSPNGLGYARIPGLFSEEHVAGWKQVTEGVHSRGGRIFVQLMHTGRVGHPANMPQGSRILAPSSIQLPGKMWTDSEGQQDHPVPQAMSLEDIEVVIHEYVTSARLAMEAGFDGVELHAANGYLLEQFLNPSANQRTDFYGGSAEGRMRFVLEVAERVSRAIGKERVGIRLSPYSSFNGMGVFEGIDDFYANLSRRLSEIGLVYIHVIEPPLGSSSEVTWLIRENFRGVYILSGGYDQDHAEVDLQEGRGDLVAFGKPFIGNPDLVERMRSRQQLKLADTTKFYTAGAEGYTDY